MGAQEDAVLWFLNLKFMIKFILLIFLHLRFLYCCVISVAHGRDFDSGVSLPISLPEELLHDPVDPLPVDLQRLRRVREVRAVHHVLKNLQNCKTKTSKVIAYLVEKLLKYTSFLIRCFIMYKYQLENNNMIKLEPFWITQKQIWIVLS